MARLGRQVDVEGDEVRLGQQFLERQEPCAETLLDFGRPPREAVIHDLHPEPERPLRDGLSDPPEPDDPDRGAVDVGPEEEHRPPGSPLTRPDMAIPLGEPARGSHQEREGKIRGRVREDAGRIPDRDAPPRACRHVDVVETDGEVRDDLELRAGAIEEFVVDPVREQGQDPFTTLDRPQEFIARRWQFLVPDTRVTGLNDRLKAVIGNDPGDEDPRAAGHVQPVAATAAGVPMTPTRAAIRMPCILGA